MEGESHCKNAFADVKYRCEMENNQRKIKQGEGIRLAQMKHIYFGRSKGARTSSEKLLSKYINIADLIDKSELSFRRIA